MEVYKFGGASIKDANAVKRMAHIISSCTSDSLVVVVSAMGKTTNHLEELHRRAFARKSYQVELNSIVTFHMNIIDDLFGSNSQKVQTQLDILIKDLERELRRSKKSNDFSKTYGYLVKQNWPTSIRCTS